MDENKRKNEELQDLKLKDVEKKVLLIEMQGKRDRENKGYDRERIAEEEKFKWQQEIEWKIRETLKGEMNERLNQLEQRNATERNEKSVQA